MFPDAWNAFHNINALVQGGKQPTIDPQIVTDTAKNILRLTISRNYGLYQTEDAQNTIKAQLFLLQSYGKNNDPKSRMQPLGAILTDETASQIVDINQQVFFSF